MPSRTKGESLGYPEAAPTCSPLIHRKRKTWLGPIAAQAPEGVIMKGRKVALRQTKTLIHDCVGGTLNQKDNPLGGNPFKSYPKAEEKRGRYALYDIGGKSGLPWGGTNLFTPTHRKRKTWLEPTATQAPEGVLMTGRKVALRQTKTRIHDCVGGTINQKITPLGGDPLKSIWRWKNKANRSMDIYLSRPRLNRERKPRRETQESKIQKERPPRARGRHFQRLLW